MSVKPEVRQMLYFVGKVECLQTVQENIKITDSLYDNFLTNNEEFRHVEPISKEYYYSFENALGEFENLEELKKYSSEVLIFTAISHARYIERNVCDMSAIGSISDPGSIYLREAPMTSHIIKRKNALGKIIEILNGRKNHP